MPELPRIMRRSVPVVALLVLAVGPADAGDGPRSTGSPTTADVPFLQVWCALEGFHDDVGLEALTGAALEQHRSTPAEALPALPRRTPTDGPRSGGTERAGDTTERPGIPGARR